MIIIIKMIIIIIDNINNIDKDARVTSGTQRVPGSLRADGFHLKDDEMVNDDDVATEMGFEKLCASGNCNSMPAKQKMQVKVNFQI